MLGKWPEMTQQVKAPQAQYLGLIPRGSLTRWVTPVGTHAMNTSPSLPTTSPPKFHTIVFTRCCQVAGKQNSQSTLRTIITPEPVTELGSEGQLYAVHFQRVPRASGH